VTAVDDEDRLNTTRDAADFTYTVGDFTFNSKHHPMQDVFVSEVGQVNVVLTNRIIGIALEDHGDACAQDCPM